MPFFFHGLIRTMCGIGGIILKQGASQDARQLAAHQTNALVTQLEHRGPDAQRSMTLNQGLVHLAHTRLAIIELSEAANQPMSSKCGRYTLVFNGEIYNFQELRALLNERSTVVASASDTETLLHWLITHRESGLEQLRGMFSLFFWDSETHTGLAARDPFGIKPFYYHHDQTNSTLSFASEVRALRETLHGEQTVNSQGVQGFLRLGSFQEPSTIIADVNTLPAGHYLLWKDGDKTIKRFWNPLNPACNEQHAPLEQMIQTREESVKHLRTALEDTISAHFVSDVPVGIFLSGGVDSTALLALATKHYKTSTKQQAIHTFSIAFEDPDWNEGDLAQKTADHFGSQHTQWLITKSEAQAMFGDYLNTIDQPSIDGFNTYCVSKLARDNGFKVVLSGVGGDELFAGYGSFKTVPRLRNLARLVSPIWPITYLIRKLFWSSFPSKLRRLTDVLVKPLQHSAAYFGFRGIFSEQESRDLLKALELESTKNTLAKRADSVLNNYELEFYMRNQLLRDSDCMSMAWGLELRVPLVDSFFYTQLLKIPEKWRLEQGKKMLIDAVPELPQWVVEQPKKGFRFPFDEWLSDDWSNLDHGFNWPMCISPNPWYRRWAVISLLNSINRLNLTSPGSEQTPAASQTDSESDIV